MLGSRKVAFALVIALGVSLALPPSALGAPTFVTKWGSEGAAPGQFDSISNLAADGLGYVYVTDGGNRRVSKFSAAGLFITAWGTNGSGDGQFQSPLDVAVDRYGYVYVADSTNDCIQKFTSSGGFVARWGSSGAGDGQFTGLTGIAVDNRGFVYASDFLGHRIQKFTDSGAYVLQWGTNGTGNGQFDRPRGVTVDRFGYVYVVDMVNDRVQKFTPEGVWVANFLPPAPNDMRFLDFDGRDNVHAIDLGGFVSCWQPNGTPLPNWGSAGSGDGEFTTPWGLSIDGGGIYVSDRGNHRVQKFRSDLPKLTARFPGANRFAVAVNASKDTWGAALTGIRDVVIVCGEDRAMCDALSAGGLAGVMDAPLLLTNTAFLSSETRQALDQIRATNGPVKIHVLGGTGSVSTKAYGQIAARNPGGTIERIGGSDRYVLSSNIAKRISTEAAARGKTIPGVLVFNAESSAAFYDALAAGAISAKQTMPMVAVRKATVPTSARNCLAGTYAGQKKYVVSGVGYVSAAVASKVGSQGRLASSSDRVTAATQIAGYARGKGWLLYENVGLANKLPDSLCGGVFMGQRDGVLLYTNTTSFPAATNTFMKAIKYGTARGNIFGGTASISSAVGTSFYNALNAQ